VSKKVIPAASAAVDHRGGPGGVETATEVVAA